MNIKSSDKKVIFSGNFVTISQENFLSFRYKDEDFNFNLSFLKDSGKTRVDYSPNENKDALIMKFYNWDNGIGTSFNEPIHVAESDGKKIFLQLMIFATGNNDVKSVNYTFYIEG